VAATGNVTAPGVRDTLGAQQFQTGTFARPTTGTTRFDQFDADDDHMPVGVSAGTMTTMMPSSLQEAKNSWTAAREQQVSLLLFVLFVVMYRHRLAHRELNLHLCVGGG
jgi:hypothetical protein